MFRTHQAKDEPDTPDTTGHSCCSAGDNSDIPWNLTSSDAGLKRTNLFAPYLDEFQLCEPATHGIDHAVLVLVLLVDITEAVLRMLFKLMCATYGTQLASA